MSSILPFIGGVNIVVTAAGGGDLPNVKVTVDDVPINTASLGVRRIIDPGEHVLVATADGYKRVETRFTVPEGGSVDAPVTLEKDPNAVVAPPPPPPPPPGGTGTGTGTPPPPPPPPDHPLASSPSPLPWIVLGVGGVGIVTGVITGAIALGDHSTLSGPCKGGTCPQSESGELNSYPHRRRRLDRRVHRRRRRPRRGRRSLARERRRRPCRSKPVYR